MSPNRHRRLRMEALESRQMMAVDLTNGLLTVTGTSADDILACNLVANDTVLRVNDNGVEHDFNAANVTAIAMYGLKGNDIIGNDSPKPSRILGGKGNDQIAGGQSDDAIFGDAGNDEIYGNSGTDTIYGDKGNDTCSGGNDNDEIYGDSGDDTLAGGDDNDFLDGGTGNDTCHGEDGNDEIKGSAGNDLLDGDGGNNLLDGGAGVNTLLNGIAYQLDRQLIAHITGDDGDATAHYRAVNDGGVLKLKFTVIVEGHIQANDDLDISVGKNLIGQVHTDNNGAGQVTFSSNPTGSELPFPSNFPSVFNKGVLVELPGIIWGKFQVQHAIP